MKKSAKSSWSSSSSSPIPQQHSQKHLPLFVVFYPYNFFGITERNTWVLLFWWKWDDGKIIIGIIIIAIALYVISVL